MPEGTAKSAAQVYFASLHSMQAYAQSVVDRAPEWRGPGGKPTLLEKLAGNNTKNADAMRNLAEMGRKPPRFLAYGSPSGLENAKLLPGVKVRVLGPPTLEQQNLQKYGSHSDEYRVAGKYWNLQGRAAGERPGETISAFASLWKGDSHRDAVVCGARRCRAEEERAGYRENAG